MEKLPNIMPDSINIRQFESKAFTNDERKNILSVFKEIDNSNDDEDKTEGVISGQKAMFAFYSKLKDKCGQAFDKLFKKIKDSYNDSYIRDLLKAGVEQKDLKTFKD